MGQQMLNLLAGALVTLLLQLAAGWLGPAGFFLALFVPLPAAYVGMRQGDSTAAGIVLLSGAVLLAINGPTSAAAYLLQFGLASWLLAHLLRRGIAWDKAIAGTLLAVATAAGAVAGYIVLARNLPVFAAVEKYLQGETERAMEIYRQAGMTPEQLKELQEIASDIGAFLLQAWPGLAVAGTAVLLLLTVCLLTVLSRGRYPMPGPPFSLWKSPEHLIWVLIVAGAGQLLTTGVAQQIALNLLLVLLPIYFLQGLAIVHFYFRQRNVTPFFRSLGYLLITIMNPLPLVVAGLGVFDLWVDFRKPRTNKTDP